MLYSTYSEMQKIRYIFAVSIIILLSLFIFILIYTLKDEKTSRDCCNQIAIDFSNRNKVDLVSVTFFKDCINFKYQNGSNIMTIFYTEYERNLCRRL